MALVTRQWQLVLGKRNLSLTAVSHLQTGNPAGLLGCSGYRLWESIGKRIGLHPCPHLTDSKAHSLAYFHWNSKYFREICKHAQGKARKIIYMKENSKSHAYWMRVAMQAAHKALPHDVPVGAILVADGEIIAEGFNRRELDCNPVGHAEILALQGAATRLNRWRLSNTILYVTLEPCPMCASAIAQARVDQVVFGAYDPIMGACGSRHDLLLDSPELSVLGGVLEEGCSDMLKSFFKARREAL